MRLVSLTLLLVAVTAFGQDTPAQKPQLPVQGPPPTNLTKLPDGHFSANSEPRSTENFEVHVVVIGETLSGISRAVLQDGTLWPQIWEQNEHIVNPHWIYPSDKILIRQVTRISEATPPTEPEAAAEPQEAPPAQEPPRRLVVSPAMAPAPPPGPRSIFNLTPPRMFPEVKEGDLYCAGFIRSESVPRDIKVVARYADNRLMAGIGDYVYLDKGLDDGVKPGTTYEVIRPTRSVNGLGMHYLEVAQVEVVLGQSGYSLARIARGCGAVEVGDVVIPYNKAEFPELPSKRPFSGTMKGSGQVPGKVVITKAALENYGSTFGGNRKLPSAGGSLSSIDRGLAAEGNVVYLDIGKDEGVKPGDLFIAFRDVPADLRENGEKARTAVAELVILKVEERASTALVTYSDDAVGQGDVVERR
jgi:hypothetical protein